MSHNLSKQSYLNILEWIIVDDFPSSRHQVAAEYAKKYGLNIRYVRGKKRVKKRTYALVNANNTGLQEAKGELMVILQDFMVIPENGIEMLVDVYRRNPNALIAPTDHLYNSKIEPNIDSEDWFNGETDVKGSLVWKNVRNQGLGIRESDSPYEFEQNYCGIPTHIAKALNGWYEFMDEGLGFDNTEFAFRALKMGYKLLVDDSNVCYGINHWKPLENRDQKLFKARHRTLSNPRYLFETELINMGVLPLVRDEKIDNEIDLKYEIPDDVEDKDVVKWLKDKAPQMVTDWYKLWQQNKKS